jgi:hypothetical protein
VGREQQNLKDKHPKRFSSPDPHYNPNLAQYRFDFGIELKVSRDYNRYIELPLDTGVKAVTRFHDFKRANICVFAHFDKDATIAPYVIFLLEKILEHFDIVFVSTARGLASSELSKIKHACSVAIVRYNSGYDFGSWKAGLDFLEKQNVNFSDLLIANDSSFEPIYSISDILDAWKM